MTVFHKYYIPFVFVSLIALSSCVNYTTKRDTIKTYSCSDFILQQDDSLGKIRNHECETVSLSTTIDHYVNGIKQLDFSGCPDTFTNAFKSHLDAWTNTKIVTDKYPDLRGEMHFLFDSISHTKDSIEFKLLVDEIWRTWSVIEQSTQP